MVYYNNCNKNLTHINITSKVRHHILTEQSDQVKWDIFVILIINIVFIKGQRIWLDNEYEEVEMTLLSLRNMTSHNYRGL